MRRLRSRRRFAPLALPLAAALGGCRSTPEAFGASPVAARAAAADLTAGFARRFTNVRRDPAFEQARNRMGRFALAPSQLFGDTALWTDAPDARSRTLAVTATTTGSGFLFVPRRTAGEPTGLGDQRHRFELTALGDGDWRWRTAVEHQIGRFPVDRMGPILTASFLGAARGTAQVRSDLRTVFPRSSAAFGRLVRFDTAIATPAGDGSVRVDLRSHIDTKRLATTMPAFARYVKQYVGPLRYRFVLSGTDGARAFELSAWQDSIRVVARVRNGRLVFLDGLPRPLTDTLAVRVVASTRFGPFTVGVKQLDGRAVIERSPRALLWSYRWNEPPEWRLPFGTTALLHESLRRPFEGEGMLVRLGFRAGENGQTLSIRDVDLVVRESWIVRWIGRLGGTAFSDFVEQAEVEENRFLAEGLQALGADLAAALGGG